MAQHITRKELKKDEFRETLTHGAEAVYTHQRQLWFYGGLALAVLVAVLGWRFYMQRQSAKASVELSDAMKVYQAPIHGPNDPPIPGEISYRDEKNKYSDAAKKFTEVADRYPRTQPGRMARYYAALSLIPIARYDEAQKDLSALESSGDEGFAALARFQQAHIYDLTGKGAQAAQIYQQLVNNSGIFVPKAVVLLDLAAEYIKTDPAQAAKLYKQVKTEFPDTQAADQADQHLQLLAVKG